MSRADALIDRFVDVIIDPFLALLFAIALLVFMWGLVVFLAYPEDETKRTEGRRHMLWGIIGMFIMIAASAIIKLLAGTLQVTL